MTHASILRSAALATLLVAGLACGPRDASKSAAASSAGGDNAVVAKLNGKEISDSELVTFIKEDLYKREVSDKNASEAYEARAQAIDSLIDERLLNDAAAKAGKKPEDYMTERIKALPVTDDEVKAFFEENRGRLPADASLEAFSSRI